MRINQDFIMVVMAGAGLLLVLALCMAALYKWISFLGGKMTRYGMHVHQMLKTDESDDENGNKDEEEIIMESSISCSGRCNKRKLIQ